MTEGKPNHTLGRTAGTKAAGSNNKNYGEFTRIENTSSNKHPRSILRFQKPHPSKAIHPTEKPVDLCRWLIRSYSDPGAVVLDHCCGSGAIPLAAILEKRQFFAVDLGCCSDIKSEFCGLPWAEVTNRRVAAALKNQPEE